MKFCALSRPDLVSLLEGVSSLQGVLRNLRSGEPERTPSPREVWACWPDVIDAPVPVPSLLVISDEEVSDFFAWSIAFLPTYLPLTSFFRVVPWSVFKEARSTPSPMLPKRGNILVGAMLGEMLTTAVGRGFLQSVPTVAFESTFSYAIGRALWAGYDEGRMLRLISDGWHFTRQLTGQKPIRITQERLEEVWAIVFRLVGTRFSELFLDARLTDILEALQGIGESGELSPSIWKRLADGKVSIASVAQSMRTARERRVETFESVMSDLLRDVRDETRISFLAGYLASLIGDGSLEHAHLVFPLLERLPTAMLWYGICASMSPSTRVFHDYGHLGLKLLRLLQKPDDLLASPSCDISLSELEVTLRGNGASKNFRRVHASFLRVELIPTVSTVVRWGGAGVGLDQLSLFEVERKQPMGASQIRRIVDSLREALALSEGLLGPQSETTARDSRFFKRKKRY
jgi:hypothetical protein